MNYEEIWREQAKRQQAEIATIRPRSFTLSLSDADVERLYEKAYSRGITPAELLEGFIGDLVCGTYTHGSDERMYAQQYFDRCCYDGNGSWLEWALNDMEYSDIVEALELREDGLGDIAYLEDNNDAEPGELEERKRWVEEAEAELKEIYDRYAAEVEHPQPYPEALQAVIDYRSELQRMKEGWLSAAVETQTERGEIS